MRASGTVLVPMLLQVATVILVELPAAILLSRSFGLNGIWMGYDLSFVTMLVLQAGYFQLVWRRKQITALI